MTKIEDRGDQPYPGVYPLQYTQVPDDVFDYWLPRLTEAELKVLLYIIRRTFGFKKNSDRISLSQMVDGILTHEGKRLDWGAGLSSASVKRGIAGLLKKGIIETVRNQSKARGYEATTYQLRFRTTPEVPLAQIEPSLSHNLSQGLPLAQIEPSLTANLSQGVPLRKSQALSSERAIQETVVQETVVQEDSNQPPPQKTRPARRTGAATPASDAADTLPVALQDPAAPAAPYSAYIAGVVQDHSTDLGDGPHWRANVTQALRLWHGSGLGEAAFVAHLHEARRLVRTYQGKQGSGTITNKMGYYFKVVTDLAGLPTELGPGR